MCDAWFFFFTFLSASEPHPGHYCILGKVSSGGLTEWRKGSTRALARLTTHASVLAVLSCNNGSWCTVIGFHASEGNISSVPVFVSVYLSVFLLDSPSSCLSAYKLAPAGFACLLLILWSVFMLVVVVAQAKRNSLCVADCNTQISISKSVYTWTYLWNGLTRWFWSLFSSYLSLFRTYFQDQIHISLRRWLALKPIDLMYK